MRLRHGIVVVVAASALVLGACSNDDKDSKSDSTSSTSASSSATTSHSASTSHSAASTSAGSDDEALATYAGTLCGIQQGFIQDASAANTQLADPATTPEQAAAILSDLSTSFGGAGLAISALGDPPNGEGAGLAEAANEVFSTAAGKFQDVATQVSNGTLADSASTEAALQPITDEFQQGLTALTTEYPTPGLDAIQQQIPGCSG